MPPSELSASCEIACKLAIVRDGTVSAVGRARYFLHGRTIQILWRQAATQTCALQQIGTSFWPTSLSVLDDNQTLIVGGKRPNGNTVIESWTFAAPEFVNPPDRVPALRDPEYSVRTIYDAAEQGRDMVSHVLVKKGASNAFLARFWDSGNVEEFQCADGGAKHHIVASPNVGLPGLHIPALSQKVGDAWAAEHVTHGYVYVFSSHAERLQSLVLIDSNKDGTLDSWIDIAPDAWTEEWGSSLNYRL
jgi:hypothetical protein